MWFKDEQSVSEELVRVENGVWKLERSENKTTVDSQDVGDTFWLRVRSDFASSEWDELVDVIDTNLEKRQCEWHTLLMEGGGCVKKVDNDRDVWYFAYRSPWLGLLCVLFSLRSSLFVSGLSLPGLVCIVKFACLLMMGLN